MSSSNGAMETILNRRAALAYSSDSASEDDDFNEDKNPANDLTRSHLGDLAGADALTQSFYSGKPELPDNSDFKILLEKMLKLFKYDSELIDDLMIRLEDLIRTNPRRDQALSELKSKIIQMFKTSRIHTQGVNSVTDKAGFNVREIDFFKEVYFAIERMSFISTEKITSTLSLGAELGQEAHRVYLKHRNGKKKEKKENGVAYLNKDLKRLLFLEGKISEIPKAAFLAFVRKNKNLSDDALNAWVLARVQKMITFIGSEVAVLEAKVLSRQEKLEPLAKLGVNYQKNIPSEVGRARVALKDLEGYLKGISELKERLPLIEKDVESKLIIPKDASVDIEKAKVSGVANPLDGHKKSGSTLFETINAGRFSLKKRNEIGEVIAHVEYSEPSCDPHPLPAEEDIQTPSKSPEAVVNNQEERVIHKRFEMPALSSDVSSSDISPLVDDRDQSSLAKPEEDLAEKTSAVVGSQERIIRGTAVMPSPIKVEMADMVENHMLVARRIDRDMLPEETKEYLRKKLAGVRDSYEERLHLQEQALLQEQQAREELEDQLRKQTEITCEANERLVQQERTAQAEIDVLKAQLAVQVEEVRQAKENHRLEMEQEIQERESLRERYDRHQQDIERRLQQMQVALRDETTAKEQIEQRLRETQVLVATLGEDNRVFHESNETLRRQSEEISLANAELQQQNEELQRQLETVQRELEEARRQQGVVPVPAPAIVEPQVHMPQGNVVQPLVIEEPQPVAAPEPNHGNPAMAPPVMAFHPGNPAANLAPAPVLENVPQVQQVQQPPMQGVALPQQPAPVLTQAEILLAAMKARGRR